MASSKTVQKDFGLQNHMEWAHTVVSAIALYACIYYAQHLFGVEGNLWLSSLILWLLINVVFIFSPFMRRIYSGK